MTDATFATAPSHPEPHLRGTAPDATPSYLIVLARIWMTTIAILAIPPGVLALCWAILRP